MEIGRRTMAILGLVLAATVLAGCTAPGDATQNVADVPITTSGQAVKLVSSDAGQYAPEVIRVKAGSVVRLEGDPETLVGGMDTIIVDGYNVQKIIAPGDNVLEFKADKAGEFSVHCANGMGNGRLIVEP